MRALSRIDYETVSSIFGGRPNALGKEISLSIQKLLWLLQSSEVLSFRYLLTFWILPGIKATDVENASGLKIDGKEFNIEAGLGQCVLLEIQQNEHGIYEPISSTDISNENKIDTDTGPCQIDKVPVENEIVLDYFKTINEFMITHAEAEIEYLLDLNDGA